MNEHIVYRKEAYLSDEIIDSLKRLENECINHDKISLKLELDYKAVLAKEADKDMSQSNEFLCLVDNRIVAYVGICGFDGLKLEVTGMVHPAYRRRGIFTKLINMAIEEYNRRPEKTLLLLCDSQSVSGQAFIKTLKTVYDFSEYEMRMSLTEKPVFDSHTELIFKKANNANQMEIASQNAIYFGKPIEEIDMPLPEIEEKRGMTIYLAYLDNKVIGKINLQLTNDEVGIFGVGVKPEYRGNGYGRSLIRFAILKAYDLKAKDVMLQVEAENEKALNLYTSSGFKVDSKMDYYRYNM